VPELPEVQTVIDDLNKKIKGDAIIDFWSEFEKSIKGKTLDEFKKAIRGRKILGARRIGKNIFIDLSGGMTLYIHLKMTGHLLVKNSKLKVKSNGSYFDDKVNQYIRHSWRLKSGRTLEFSDLRKFGKIVLDSTENISHLKEIQGLGIDAMDDKFNLNFFEEILTRKEKSPIGIILMDQSLISGIGNIYRSEILFESGVLPERKAGRLTQEEKKKIFRNTKKILKKAIKYRGTSDSDYRDTSGAPGSFQKVMRVYNHEGEKCPKCGTMIVRGKIGQRSVFVCPVCQK
jgi:formamidopyrimidine-DNA glycosylase